MRLALSILLLAASCKGKAASDKVGTQSATQTENLVTISIVGTNDLHGSIERLPVFAGYLKNLRAARKASGGVILLDAGDMFQGTLVSNSDEGATVVGLYNALGYDAAAVGNHEFDFGPVGAKTVAENETDDPVGALRARAKQAKFPFLLSNIVIEKNGGLPEWDNVKPTTIVERAGIKVGVIGVSTVDTLTTTRVENVRAFKMMLPEVVIAKYAKNLRDAGAQAIVVVAHAGGACAKGGDPEDTSSCRVDSELFQLAKNLPPNTVDVIVAGHTHAAVAHQVNAVAMIESWAHGTAFGRVDLIFSDGKIVDKKIHATQTLCSNKPRAALQECTAGDYAGAPVQTVQEINKLVSAASERTRPLVERKLGVTVTDKVRRNYREESALGNLFVDLMHMAYPKADVVITNGGGLRADLPVGDLTYGDLYRASPFDNRLVEVASTGAMLRKMVETNLARDNGILSYAGVRVDATCAGGQIKVDLLRGDGKRIKDTDSIKIVTTDFLAAGGDGLFKGATFRALGQAPMRDVMAQSLAKWGRPLSGKDPLLLNRDKPRVKLTGMRPMSCKQ